MEVVNVYKYSLLLSDGNVWNRGKVVKVPECIRREKVSGNVTKSLTINNDYHRPRAAECYVSENPALRRECDMEFEKETSAVA
ncbi:hypothetical protein NDU88_007734 [Pleurodeles waltl]|uniref:Uncharacterized protein n=1 Tax=Pleurodeles waltl TaxID=8319 RepID=A0AAV7U2E4_PLEWA|nr:hypothetical protein NDU88_007734 [Pleurodeles waltl]